MHAKCLEDSFMLGTTSGKDESFRFRRANVEFETRSTDGQSGKIFIVALFTFSESTTVFFSAVFSVSTTAFFPVCFFSVGEGDDRARELDCRMVSGGQCAGAGEAVRSVSSLNQSATDWE